MDWKKSDYSKAQLEAQQRAYIKEALEMAKRSVAAAAQPQQLEASAGLITQAPSAEERADIGEEAAAVAKEAVSAEETLDDTESAVEEEQAAEEATEEVAEEAEAVIADTDFISKEELTRFIPEKEEKETPAPQTEKLKKDVPLSLNQYVSNHNRNQCNCHACQAKRTGK